jgi:hypothetical protein
VRDTAPFRHHSGTPYCEEHTVIPFPQFPRIGDERLDLHNVSIDGPAAAAGCCGMIHLPSGRICRARARHAGGCDFVPIS